MTNFNSKYTTKKGTRMPDREQSPKHTAKTPSHRTGIFATLRALLRGRGNGAPSHRLIAVPLALVAVALLPSAALASPPTLTINPITEHGIVSAKVSGEISIPADGAESYWGFEFSENGTEWRGSPFSGGGPLPPGTSIPVS